MKVIIEIDDKLYKDIHTIGIPIGKIDYVLKAIKNSTPLPKGHGRLIDADELKKIIQENDVLNMTGFNVRLCDIDNTPTVIEADER